MNYKEYKKRILVTGGAGFIGSHVVRLLCNKYSEYLIVVFDKLTYAGNLQNLEDLHNHKNYVFYKGDIVNENDIKYVFDNFYITDIIHLAAESHVDRSILNPKEFVDTNVIGTFNLLNISLNYWKDNLQNHRFHHVSTDEVYGSLKLNEDTQFTENTKYDPHSPYSASKAASDHFVKAYHDTYDLNITISNCSNNYGPNQFPEKLIPLVINNLKEDKEIPVYGTGDNVRDWLYVEDHAKAIDLIFHKGISGETYNIGGMHEVSNIDIINTIIKVFAHEMQLIHIKNGTRYFTNPEPMWIKKYKENIKFIEDRKGHDKRYAINCSKLINELGWKPEETFETGITKTVKWYLDNNDWIDNVTSGEYKKWIYDNYNNRDKI